MNPLLRDVPEQLATERLLIRMPRPGDGPMLMEAVLESLDALKPWMPWAHQPVTVESEEQVARRMQIEFLERTSLPYFLLKKDTLEFVGGTGLHRFDWDVPRFEIGYWVRTRFQGMGYVSEAVRGLSRLAFDTFAAERVEIRMDDRNERSWRVAERNHFTLEGILRSDARDTRGELRDTRIYSMLRTEWQQWYANDDTAQNQTQGT